MASSNKEGNYWRNSLSFCFFYIISLFKLFLNHIKHFFMKNHIVSRENRNLGRNFLVHFFKIYNDWLGSFFFKLNKRIKCFYRRGFCLFDRCLGFWGTSWFFFNYLVLISILSICDCVFLSSCFWIKSIWLLIVINIPIRSLSLCIWILFIINF